MSYFLLKLIDDFFVNSEVSYCWKLLQRCLSTDLDCYVSLSTLAL